MLELPHVGKKLSRVFSLEKSSYYILLCSLKTIDQDGRSGDENRSRCYSAVPGAAELARPGDNLHGQ